MDNIESIKKEIRNTEEELIHTEEELRNTKEILSTIKIRISKHVPLEMPMNLETNEKKLIEKINKLTDKEQQLRFKLKELNKDLDRLKEGRDIPRSLPYYVNRKEQEFKIKEGRDIPRSLPYHVNRKEQEFKIKEALKKMFHRSYSQPLLYLIHGDQSQCLEKFFEHLKKEYLPKIFKGNTNITTNNNYIECITDYDLNWPPRNTNIEDLKKRLEHNLVDTVLDNKLAVIADINEYLASIGTVIIRTQLLSSDLQKNSSIMIEKFIEFWQDWPNLSYNQYLIIFLFIKYEIEPNQNYFQKLHNWGFQNIFKKSSNTRTSKYSIQKSIKNLSSSNFTKFDKIMVVVLPELEGITQKDVEDWARSKEVKHYWDEENIQDLIDRIEDMFEKWKKQQADDTMPMRELAKNLINILRGQ
jgi:hypothetical protein